MERKEREAERTSIASAPVHRAHEAVGPVTRKDVLASGIKLTAPQIVADFIEVSGQTTETADKAVDAGTKTGSVVARAVSGKDREPAPPSGLAETLKEKIPEALLPHVFHPRHDATGRYYENRLQALGADIALGIAFGGGVLSGATGEIVKGASKAVVNPEPVTDFIAEKKAERADRAAETARAQERAEIREAKTGRPQDSLGRLALLGGTVESRILSADTVDLARGPAAAQEEARQKKAPSKPVKLSRADEVRYGVGVGGSYSGLVAPRSENQKDAERAEETATHGLRTRAGLLLASATAGASTLVAKAKSKAKDVKAPKAPRAPDITPPSAALPGTPMSPQPLGSSSPMLGAYVDQAKAKASQAKTYVQQNPGKAAALGGSAALLGAVGTTAVVVAKKKATAKKAAKAPAKKASAKAPAKSASSRSSKGKANARGIIRGRGLGPKEIDHSKKGKKLVTFKDKKTGKVVRFYRKVK